VAASTENPMTLGRQVGFAIVLTLVASKKLEARPPFSNALPSLPTSPYFNLFNNTRSTSPYQTLVRPQLENEARFRDNQHQLDRLDRQQFQLQQLTRLPPPTLRGPQPKRGISQSIRATGHETRFLDNRRFSDHKQYFTVPRIR
jgi:hypothetical protein